MLLKLNQEISVYYEYFPSTIEEKGVVLIVHGMAEHISRYQEFATYLSEQGYHVYGYDQRGHGQTAGYLEAVGYLGKNGWSKAVDDIKDMVTHIRGQHDLPVYVLGHSMGSFISREFTSKYSEMIDGLILSGTGYRSGFQGHVMIGIAKIQSFLLGDKHPSVMIDRMTNKVFNAKIKPLKTRCDWLSFNNDNVDAYIADPYCGTVFSSSFYAELFSAVERVNKKELINKTRKELPILLFSGKDDPVGGYGVGVENVYKMYKENNEDVHVILYEGRHEMLNENDRDDVYHDIKEWLDNR